MSSQTGKPSQGASPHATAAALGLRWNTPGKSDGLITWDVLLDLAVVAYWLRRPEPEPAARKTA